MSKNTTKKATREISEMSRKHGSDSQRDEELKWMDKLLEKSELTEEDAERIGHKIKNEISKRFERKINKTNH
ncbi:hypothetical protein HY988_04875 [Candidatus Micrarchaeota archaeon]|nr:hypothetical protein [Candidatus Micrarchaeota archaeon]